MLGHFLPFSNREELHMVIQMEIIYNMKLLQGRKGRVARARYRWPKLVWQDYLRLPMLSECLTLTHTQFTILGSLSVVATFLLVGQWSWSWHCKSRQWTGTTAPRSWAFGKLHLPAWAVIQRSRTANIPVFAFNTPWASIVSIVKVIRAMGWRSFEETGIVSTILRSRVTAGLTYYRRPMCKWESRWMVGWNT